MALYDLADRLNWQQACDVLGCGKTHLYSLVRRGKLRMYGTGRRYRWFSRMDLEEILKGEHWEDLSERACQGQKKPLS
ncbi:MAG TPA: helix-turn-helix domain-containing protein [Candidatus Bilophila faecipullorum]|uniref:Helix-turn-helix domain-containing protein n=1 Tax=Candidatus Bilophila faecipullorum TaxID=2838482 RepID=A0A9D1QYU2_9BACT|nr:helix-turn-helix domain-containing protein [Candidatus Bilophila faecipullorum]